MDHGSFAALTRSLANGAGPRRVLLRFVAGGALGGMVSRLGLDEDALGKKKGKRQPQRQSALHDEGRHRKKKHRRKAKNPQQPQVCGDDERRCEDGRCVTQGLCCPDEAQCGDGTCVSQEQCCFGRTRCDDGTCIEEDQCCPTAKRCGDGSCIAPNQCCPDAIPPGCDEGACQAAVCEGGDLVCRSTCQGESVDCCHGGCWYACPPGSVRDFDSCECACPSGSELLADASACCPSHRACGRNGAGLPTFCCDEANICRASGQECS